MSTILDKLKASREVIKTVSLGDVVLGMRIMTERDYQDSGWAANALLDKIGADLKPSNADLFESEKATEASAALRCRPGDEKARFLQRG